jgi:hypothetical protein
MPVRRLIQSRLAWALLSNALRVGGYMLVLPIALRTIPEEDPVKAAGLTKGSHRAYQWMIACAVSFLILPSVFIVSKIGEYS